MIALHGFTQTSYSWGPFGCLLSQDHELVLVDAPFHGLSCDLDVSFEESADLLCETGGPAHYLGYSMGGRITLYAAIAHPEYFKSLVLISASPGIADGEHRKMRARSDLELANSIVSTPEFVGNWLSGEMFSTLTPDLEDLEHRYANPPTGLRKSLILHGVGSQVSLWERLDELSMPVLLLAGATDHKFMAISNEMAEAIGPNAKVEIVRRAGHATHLEQPDITSQLVKKFLSSLESQS